MLYMTRSDYLELQLADVTREPKLEEIRQILSAKIPVAFHFVQLLRCRNWAIKTREIR